MEIAFGKVLRDAAMLHTDAKKRKALRDNADAVDYATKLFIANQTSVNLRHLNGVWSVAYNYLFRNPPPEDTAPRGGAMPKPKRRRAA